MLVWIKYTYKYYFKYNNIIKGNYIWNTLLKEPVIENQRNQIEIKVSDQLLSFS